ncbi:MAG: ATP-binding protein [Saprospiraceae bacterium]
MAIKKYTPLELMQMAIDESHLSIPEHTDKTDPLVGAIIATADGVVLAKAHRGELREGEHCEFTLIERKLVNVNLNGCVLYVTLEPCTDESRKKPKRGCSTHIGKARLSKVYIGVEDPNPKIAGTGVKAIKDKGIEVEMFPANLQEKIWKDNAAFKKEKEAEALKAKLEEKKLIKDVLQLPVSGSTIKSFSDSTIQMFINESGASFKYPSPEFNEWAQEFGFLDKDEKSGALKPTGLGIMVFGKNPETPFPQTVFKVEINYGKGKPEVRDFKGPLVSLLPAVLDYVKDKGLKLTMDKSAGKRKEVADFPFEVLLEAVANAVIHRDYTIEGATNYLYIDPDKIIVRSPGAPTYPLTLNDLEDFDAPSISRNPKIMYVFNQMHLAEQRGIGLRNMKHLPDEGFPLPTFRMKAGMLEVTFGRTPTYLAQKAGLKHLDEADRAAVLFIQSKGTVSRSEFAQHFDLNPKTAQRQLSKLKDAGLLRVIGAGKYTKYEYNK